MKKILSLALVLTLLVFALASCSEANDTVGNATLVIATEEIQVYDIPLEELSKGRTVIVVAHRLSTVKNADEIVVLDKNGIIERGNHLELIERGGEYKKLYEYQFRQ